MERFWARHDPDPETPINEGRLEFRRRVTVVRERLGGFNAGGARDPRGQVYLLLGGPDEVSRQVLPINETDQEEAKVRVFDNYAPEREGTWMKRPGDRPEVSKQSARELAATLQGTRKEKGYELWVYDNAGRSLFPHPYSHQSLGLRFLFVDRTGTGVWILESTNAVDIGG
jgi:GWxTD domain-containing protein